MYMLMLAVLLLQGIISYFILLLHLHGDDEEAAGDVNNARIDYHHNKISEHVA